MVQSMVQSSVQSRVQSPGFVVTPAVYGLVIKPGTERNEMERNEMEKSVKRVDSGAVRLARRTAGRQARHRVHFNWTQSNAEGVWTSSNIEGVWTPSNAEAEGPSC